MFIQVISGKTSDPEAFVRQGEKWEQELRPGAKGFLGATIGVTDDGRFIAVARFDSEASANANSDRPEQGAWWAEMEKIVDSAEFKNSTDIVTMLGGGKNDAGFVQVMRGRVTDAAKLAEVRGNLATMEKVFSEARPDVVGEVIAMHDDGTYTDIVYFSSEAEARANETKEMSAEAQAMFESLMSAVAVDEYLDLSAPDAHVNERVQKASRATRRRRELARGRRPRGRGRCLRADRYREVRRSHAGSCRLRQVRGAPSRHRGVGVGHHRGRRRRAAGDGAPHAVGRRAPRGESRGRDLDCRGHGGRYVPPRRGPRTPARDGVPALGRRRDALTRPVGSLSPPLHLTGSVRDEATHGGGTR